MEKHRILMKALRALCAAAPLLLIPSVAAAQSPEDAPEDATGDAPSDAPGAAQPSAPDGAAESGEPQAGAPEAPEVAAVVIEAAERLRAIVGRIDSSAQFNATGASFTVSGLPILFVHDVNANRMRLMSPAGEAAELSEEDLMRLMQANFESALDARYGVARGLVWSTFIHPLSTLSSEEFVSGLGQVVNLVNTYGGTYNSGVFSFGGGDNAGEGQELIDELQERAREI